jgi:hypothetical protein
MDGLNAMDELERRPRKETKLHHKPEDDCEDECDSGPGGRSAQTFSHDFDEEDDDKEEKREEKSVRNEDAGGTGRSDEDVLEVKQRDEGADEKNEKKNDELNDCDDDLFHGGLSR